MVYCYNVYQTLLDITRKDARGLALSVEEFNNIAPLVNELLFDKYYSDFEDTQENSEAMSAFKVLNESIAVGGGGIASLPANYYYMVGMPRYTDLSGTTRYLDMVSSLEHAKREQDYLTKASLTYPTFRFGIATAVSPMTLYVTPATGINPILIDYIRIPATPYLDYYIDDVTYEQTWLEDDVVAMPVAHTAPKVVKDGVTLRAETTGAANVTGYTVDFEWSSSDIPMLISLFLQQMGIALPDEVLFQGGQISEQKIDNE
jgi:hypothetical protein